MSILKPKKSVIRFVCGLRDDGLITPPVPAKTYILDWFRTLPTIDTSRV